MSRNMDIKCDSGESSGTKQKKKESWRESFSLYREYIIIRNKMLIEIWTLKSILIWSQTEMKNTLLDSGEKVIH